MLVLGKHVFPSDLSVMYNMDKIKNSNHLLTWGHKDIDKKKPKFCEDKSFKNSMLGSENCLYYQTSTNIYFFMTYLFIQTRAQKQL